MVIFLTCAPGGEYSPSSIGTILNSEQLDYFGNIFIQVPNIPPIIPKYASDALSLTITEYVKDIARGLSRGDLMQAICIKDGKILDEAIIKALKIK